MSMIKNISKAEVLVLKDQVAYQEGQVVSKTLAEPCIYHPWCQCGRTGPSETLGDAYHSG